MDINRDIDGSVISSRSMTRVLLLACLLVAAAALLEPMQHPIHTDLEHRLAALENLVATLQTQVNRTERDLAASRAEVNNLENKLKSAKTPHIAFESVLLQTIDHHTNLIFDTTPLNLGSHYDMFNGVFTSPFPGVYLLWANVQSDDDSHFGIRLMVNGLKQTAGFTASNNSYGTASLFSVNYLNTGTTVSFQHEDYLTKPTFKGDGYSSFGGVLLQKLD